MDLELFKKEADKIKQIKLEAEAKERIKRETVLSKTYMGVLELIGKLRPYIEYATKEFNLNGGCKTLTHSIPYAYTATIRWCTDPVEATFLYSGHGDTITFSINNILLCKEIASDKDKLQWIGDAFHPKNLDYFVKDLLKRLESNDIYFNQ